MKLFASIAAASALLLGACAATTTGAEDAVDVAVDSASTARLASILDTQPDEVQARFDARNPAATLAFFGIEPGMTVAEALPGGGWYSKILVPYLGEDGTLIGAHYPNDMWARFGFGDEWAAERVKGTENWLNTAAEWGVEGAGLQSVILTDMPDEATGQVDAVLFIRALHNLGRFNDEHGYLDKTLAETYRVLKPGGVVGVVQHRAPETAPDASAKGQRGYMKQSDLVAKFEAAGFVLDGTSEVNANAKDVPGTEDIVWRLPPSLNGTEDGTPEREAVVAIGESDRMTLRFKKPA